MTCSYYLRGFAPLTEGSLSTSKSSCTTAMNGTTTLSCVYNGAAADANLKALPSCTPPPGITNPTCSGNSLLLSDLATSTATVVLTNQASCPAPKDPSNPTLWNTQMLALCAKLAPVPADSNATCTTACTTNYSKVSLQTMKWTCCRRSGTATEDSATQPNE